MESVQMGMYFFRERGFQNGLVLEVWGQIFRLLYSRVMGQLRPPRDVMTGLAFEGEGPHKRYSTKARALVM